MRSHAFHHPLTVVLLAVGVSNVRAQIPDGFEVVRLTNSENPDRWPRINNRSEATWTEFSFDGTLSQILLYTEGRVERVTDPSELNVASDLNNLGALATDQGRTMVWMHRVGPTTQDHDIQGLVNGVPTMIAQTPFNDGIAVLNDAGMVAWLVDFSGNSTNIEIFLDDGLTVQQITDNGLSNRSPEINARGDITWYVMDLAADPFLATLMLYRYDDGSITALTDGTTSVRGPDITDDGVIVWYDETGIKLWEQGRLTAISGKPSDQNPDINERRDIVFNRFHPEIGAWQIWLWHNSEFVRITDNDYWNTNPHINELGEICWTTRPPDAAGDIDMMMMRRIAPAGDFDHDCHVDFTDFWQLQRCFTGSDASCPGGLLGDCTRGDFDNDDDVDLDDVAEFLGAVTGPLNEVVNCEP